MHTRAARPKRSRRSSSANGGERKSGRRIRRGVYRLCIFLVALKNFRFNLFPEAGASVTAGDSGRRTGSEGKVSRLFPRITFPFVGHGLLRLLGRDLVQGGAHGKNYFLLPLLSAPLSLSVHIYVCISVSLCCSHYQTATEISAQVF